MCTARLGLLSPPSGQRPPKLLIFSGCLNLDKGEIKIDICCCNDEFIGDGSEGGLQSADGHCGTQIRKDKEGSAASPRREAVEKYACSKTLLVHSL